MIARLSLMAVILSSQLIACIAISEEEMLAFKCQGANGTTFRLSHGARDTDREVDQDMFEEQCAYLKIHLYGHDWHAVKLVHHKDCPCEMKR